MGIRSGEATVPFLSPLSIEARIRSFRSKYFPLQESHENSPILKQAEKRDRVPTEIDLHFTCLSLHLGTVNFDQFYRIS